MLATVTNCRSCSRTHTVTFRELARETQYIMGPVDFQDPAPAVRYSHEARCPVTGETLIWGEGLGVWTL